jgi:hypothetical protein
MGRHEQKGCYKCFYGSCTLRCDVREAGKATGDAAKKTGSAMKKESKSIAHKSAKKVRKGAEKVEDKTN